MPAGTISVESPIADSFRVVQVRGMFDVPEQTKVEHSWSYSLPIEELDWQIGLIVGPSGSGKTVLGSRLFPDAHLHTGYQWDEAKSVLDGFPTDIDTKEIVGALSSVGFSSPPHWLKRYGHLSNGQKFRRELARVLLESAPTVVFDEFTSVVDRDAAKVSSAAVAKAIRKRGGPRLVALSCHFDIIDWLDPDWVYNVSTGEFARRSLRRRPDVELEIHSADPRSWQAFSGHHYLSKTIHKTGAKCFVALWNEIAVGFTSYMHLVHPRVKKTSREHRTVVLPDYQGVGIGNALSEWLGEYLHSLGKKFVSTTSHPAMIRHRSKSPRWSLARAGHAQPQMAKGLAGACSSRRFTVSFRYIPRTRDTQTSQAYRVAESA